jgi:SagB-type dehydrogenase family enzyme
VSKNLLLFTGMMFALGTCVTPIQSQTEHDQEPVMRSIGHQFHEQTSFGDSGYEGKHEVYGKRVPQFKSYSKARRFRLPRPTSKGLSVEEAIHKRRSRRSYTKKPVTLEEATLLLRSAYGITRRVSGFAHRSVPSAGGLFPTEIYLVARRVDSVPAGLYHFQVEDTTLALLEEGDLGEEVWQGCFTQEPALDPSLFVLISARFDRTTKKYADRGYRYAYMEAGSVYQNVYLQATSLGLGTVVLGAFNDDALNALLNIDGIREAVLCVMPVGVPR